MTTLESADLPLMPTSIPPAPLATPAPTSAPAPTPLAPVAPFGLVDELLRDRPTFLARLAESDDLATLARTMLVTILACSASFGATLGLSHGGWQLVFSAVKLPLAMLFTAGLASPALSAMRAATDGATDIRRDFALVLGSLAFGSIVLAALAPVVVLAWMLGAGYHDTILLTFACCSVAGVATLQLFRRGLAHASRPSRLVLLTTMLVFALVGAQMCWSLRPFVAHPSGTVTFVRPLEGGLFDSVSTSFDSARGIYSSAEERR